MLGDRACADDAPPLLMLDEPSQGIMPKLVDEIFAASDAIRRAGTSHSHCRTASHRVPGDRQPRLCAPRQDA